MTITIVCSSTSYEAVTSLALWLIFTVRASSELVSCIDAHSLTLFKASLMINGEIYIALVSLCRNRSVESPAKGMKGAKPVSEDSQTSQSTFQLLIPFDENCILSTRSSLMRVCV